MRDEPFRFYRITVVGTDFAGNSGRDTCNVVLMPYCYTEKYGCNSTRVKCGKSYRFYPSIKEVDDSIAKSSRVLYSIADTVLKTASNTTSHPPPTPPTTGEPTFNPTSKPTTNRSCEDHFYVGCSKVSCQDEKRLCDGTWNYDYIAYRMGGETSIICFIHFWSYISALLLIYCEFSFLYSRV